MADLNLRVTLTARNRADRALRSTRDRVKETNKHTRQLDRSARTVAGRWLDISKNTGVSSRLLRQQAREYEKMQRQARRLNYQEVRRTEQIRAQERALRAKARRELGLGGRRGPGFDPDAPATNLSTAANAMDRFADAGERGIRSIAETGLEYGKAAAEVQTLTDNLNPRQIDEMAFSMAQLGAGTPTDQVRALYQVVSAGATDAASAQEQLAAANKLAIGGVTDITSGFDALNAIMKPYGDEVGSADRAVDLLFTTVAQGKTTIPELAANLSKITPVAKEAGISIEEVLASVSAITASTGASTEEAATQIAGSYAKVIKQSKQAQKEFKRLRKGSSELQGFADIGDAVDTLGLTGFTEAAQRSSKFNSQSMGRLFEDVRALKGQLTLTGPAADKFAQDLEGLANSAGKGEKAVAKMGETDAVKLAKLNAKWEEQKILLSRQLLPAITKMAAEVMPTIEALSKFAQQNPWVAKVALAMVAGGKIGAPILHGMSGIAGLTGGRGFGMFAGQRPAVGGQGALGKANVGASNAIGGAIGAGPALLFAATAGYALGTKLDELTGASDWLSRKFYEVSGSPFFDKLNDPGQTDVANDSDILTKRKQQLAEIEAEIKAVQGKASGLGFNVDTAPRELTDERARLKAEIRRREGKPSQEQENFRLAKGALESLGIDLNLKVDQDGRVTGANLASAKGARVDLTTDVGVTRG